MLLDEYVEIRWNPNNIKYYQSKGYKFTKKGDLFLVKIEDLSNSSSVRVRVKCDYNKEGCKGVSYVRWADYIKIHKGNTINKDCCNNRKCSDTKTKESNIIKYGCESVLSSDSVKNKIKETNIEKYGVENVFASEEIKEKIKETNLKKYGFENPNSNIDVRNKTIQTNLEKYGVENVFASEEIKQKIKETNLEKYGVEVPTQNPDIFAKCVSTCLERYGVPYYGAFYSSEHKGELSPTWKGGFEYHRVERSTYEYRDWRKQVFDRDLYTCQCFGYRNGIGLEKVRELNAHHIKNWKNNEDLRYDVDNGITLCEKCHTAFHSKYGKRNNTKEQLEEFLNLDKKVC